MSVRVQTSIEIDSCGGCASLGQGIDCVSVPGVASATCLDGLCETCKSFTARFFFDNPFADRFNSKCLYPGLDSHTCLKRISLCQAVIERAICVRVLSMTGLSVLVGNGLNGGGQLKLWGLCTLRPFTAQSVTEPVFLNSHSSAVKAGSWVERALIPLL